MASDRLFFTGPIVFHSACSRLISAAARSQSVDSASASTATHSASFFAKFSAQTALRLREILLAPGEEAIAGGAEPLPDRLFLAARDRADGLPFGLQPFDRLGGLHPVGRVGERLGPLAERDLLREVLGAHAGLGGEVRLAPRPDLVVRGLEAPPQRLALRARHVGGLAPLLLQLADPARDRLRDPRPSGAPPSSRRAVPGCRRSPSAATRRLRAGPGPSASAPPARPSAAARRRRSRASTAAAGRRRARPARRAAARSAAFSDRSGFWTSASARPSS